MIKVLFFGRLRDQLATTEIQVLCTEKQTIEQLREQLKARDENWRRALCKENLLVAVNQTICNEDIALQSEDEVAFFPPVTGG